MKGILIGGATAALMVYAVAAQPSGRKWAHSRLLTLCVAATCALALALLGRDIFGLGVFGLLLLWGALIYMVRAAVLQWRLLRAGCYAGVVELSRRAADLQGLREEIRADRAWIVAQMQRSFKSTSEVEIVVREIRGRQQQIEQRQAKLADRRAYLTDMSEGPQV